MLGVVYLVVIMVIALTAIPLLILTNAGPELTRTEFDIGLHVLDHQLLDKDGRRCGNVDDLAIEGGAGESAEVVAILVGPGYWRQRSRRVGDSQAVSVARSGSGSLGRRSNA